MHAKRGLVRTSFDTDQDFELAVDEAAREMGVDQKRGLLFSLLRECRGCGSQPLPETLKAYWVHQANRSVLTCDQCQRGVHFPLNSSLGRLVTLWNTTPLTIESEPVHA